MSTANPSSAGARSAAGAANVADTVSATGATAADNATITVGAAQPVGGQPGANQPTAGRPVASQPTAGQPIASQPTEGQPDASPDVAFMRLAIEQARAAAGMGEVPIGAVVVYEGAVIATGYNRRETDADPSAHAEFSALIDASRRLGRWRLTGCTVYVTLEPCLMCAGLMQQARIDRCVYGAPDPKGGALGTLYGIHRDERLNHRFEVTAGICEQECSALLSDFFAQLRAQRGSKSGTGGATS